MRIINAKGKAVKAVFQFEHMGHTVSVTTRGNFPEVAVFPPAIGDDEPQPRSFGPFRSVHAAMQFAEHAHNQRILQGQP